MKPINETGESREGLGIVLAIFLVGALGLVIGLVYAGRVLEAGLGVLMIAFAGMALRQQVAARRARR